MLTFLQLDLNTAVYSFYDALHYSILNYIPTWYFAKSTFPSWITKKFRYFIPKNKAHSRSKSSRDPLDYIQFSLLCAKYLSSKFLKLFF
jgi:hypothetical protein